MQSRREGKEILAATESTATPDIQGLLMKDDIPPYLLCYGDRASNNR